MAKQKFQITGMTCSACSAHVEKAVRKLEGIRAADVSLMTNSMTAEYDENVVSNEDIINAVIQSGYGASLPRKAGAKAQAAPQGDTMAQELAAEGIVLLENKDRALPLESGAKVNLFGYASVSPPVWRHGQRGQR